MLIKSVTVRNFLCYHKDNRFEFSDGLTLLIGDNGDGKTTVFDAVRWLIDSTARRPRLDLVSAMRRKELMVGDSDVVSVSMDFEHGGEKTIEKSFRFTKTGPGIDDFSVSDFHYTGREMRDRSASTSLARNSSTGVTMLLCNVSACSKERLSSMCSTTRRLLRNSSRNSPI